MENNEYPNWLVPLYIAKELKEIGLDEPCNHYVRISNDDIKLKINHSSIGWVILKRNSEYLNDDIASFVTIPTWTQVFAWFKKHYYHVNIDDKGTWIHWSFYNEMIEPPIIENEPKDGWETDYYEALEALVVALIKTYKQEQLK